MLPVTTQPLQMCSVTPSRISRPVLIIIAGMNTNKWLQETLQFQTLPCAISWFRLVNALLWQFLGIAMADTGSNWILLESFNWELCIFGTPGWQIWSQETNFVWHFQPQPLVEVFHAYFTLWKISRKGIGPQGWWSMVTNNFYKPNKNYGKAAMTFSKVEKINVTTRNEPLPPHPHYQAQPY